MVRLSHERWAELRCNETYEYRLRGYNSKVPDAPTPFSKPIGQQVVNLGLPMGYQVVSVTKKPQSGHHHVMIFENVVALMLKSKYNGINAHVKGRQLISTLS